jgi:glycosyltransferase involved in cell wall biosynthesis
MESSSQPLVTAIVLCYNQARFVIESLESVRNQTYKNIQLIIIDDASGDDSAALIRRWIKEHTIDCRFMAHEKNMGICKTLNEALSYAKGKYIALLASDDVWMPNKTQDQVAIMERLDLSFGVVYSDAVIIDEEGVAFPELHVDRCKKAYNFKKAPEGDVFLDLLANNFILAATVLIRKDSYEKVGLYDENLAFEDYDMWLRISQHYKFAFLSTASTMYRLSKTSALNTLLATSRGDFFSSLIIIFSKCFSSDKIDKYHNRMLREKMTQYAEALYETNYKGKNRYISVALRCVPEVKIFLIYVCSLLNIDFSFYSRIKGILIHFRRAFLM